MTSNSGLPHDPAVTTEPALQHAAEHHTPASRQGAVMTSPAGSQLAVASGPGSGARYVVLTWLCVAAVVAYIQRMSIGVAAPQIRASLQIDEPTMGWVMSAYYWSYALSQVPAGVLAGRFGTRRMLAASVLASSLLTGLVAGTGAAPTFGLFWLLTGISIAGIFPCCVRLIADWFPAQQRAMPSGVLSSAMSIGGAVSTALTGWLLLRLANEQVLAWRLVFLLYAIPGVLWSVSFLAWFPRGAACAGRTFGSGSAGQSGQSSHGDVITQGNVPVVDAGAVLDRPGWLWDYRTWLICTQQFFRAGGYVFYATWFPTYLKEVHHVSLASAGLLTSLPLLGVVVGGAAGGVFCDWLEGRTGSKRISRQGMGIFSHAVCGLLIFAAQQVTNPVSAVYLISLGSLIFALGSSGSYAITIDLGGSRSGTLFALMNMSGNIGAALSPIVVGALIPRLGWSPVLPFFGTVYLACAACWMLLNPVARAAGPSNSSIR